MDQCTRLKQLITYLKDLNHYEHSVLPEDKEALFLIYRGLINLQKPGLVDPQFIQLQDEMLQVEIAAKGIVDIADFPNGISIWQGDITRLNADAIVNAANSQMLGCFLPNHSCIDNVIHTYAGIQLRNECSEKMIKQGMLEPIGKAKVTAAYNLPCRTVIHTVGPMVRDRVTEKECYLLRSCYQSCLNAAENLGLTSIAFCCISTGVFRFPNELAAQIAYDVLKDASKHSSIQKIIIDVFIDKDREIYEKLQQA